MTFPRDFVRVLHDYKVREFRTVFARCPPGLFESVLELGTGDGYQSALLSPLTRKLISTDLNIDRFANRDLPNVEYRACDAQRIGEEFPPHAFDLVYSTNMLEHVDAPALVAKGIQSVLRPNGISIHIMPSVFWKLTSVALHIPNMALRAAELLVQRQGIDALRAKVVAPTPDANVHAQRSRLARLFVPEIHGVSRSHYQELHEFRVRKWTRLFEDDGFVVRKVVRGPVITGYAFGADRLRKLAERAGFASVYGYILTRKGEDSPYLQYFV